MQLPKPDLMVTEPSTSATMEHYQCGLENDYYYQCGGEIILQLCKNILLYFPLLGGSACEQPLLSIIYWSAAVEREMDTPTNYDFPSYSYSWR